MKKFIALLEELDAEQRKYVDNALGGDKYDPEEHHQDMFNSYEGTPIRKENRLIFSQKIKDKFVDPELKIHLKKHGWDIHDYHAGLASRVVKDRNGNDKLEVRKIGKVLQQTGGDKVPYSKPKNRLIKDSNGQPILKDGRWVNETVPQTLSDFYKTDPVRESTKNEHNIIITRGKYDIGGMTSGRNWEMSSCMRLPSSQTSGGSMRDKIQEDFKQGTLVAYSVKKGDDDIESPSGRILIKKYQETNTENPHTIYRPDITTYGNVPDGFKEHVESLMKKHYPAKAGSEYKMADRLYADGRYYIEPIKTGLHKTYITTENYNSEGKLHDYVDENGVKQPAIKSIGGNYTHYKDGKIHNENGIAKRVGEMNYHYINGELHREGDKPAVYSDSGDHEEYHVGGILHRDGNKPAFRIKDNYLDHTEYFHAGLSHSPNKDTFASVVKGDQVEEMTHKKFGVLHSPDNDTPSSIYKNTDGEFETTTHQYRKDGELHREDDKPAFIRTHRNTVTKKWYKDGKEYREDDKPTTEVCDLNGKLKTREWANRVGDDKPAVENYAETGKIQMFRNEKGDVSYLGANFIPYE